MRVLLIEDYEPLARSLAQGLREAGYAVDATGNGEEGLGLAQANPYDALVLDLMVPEARRPDDPSAAARRRLSHQRPHHHRAR